MKKQDEKINVNFWMELQEINKPMFDQFRNIVENLDFSEKGDLLCIFYDKEGVNQFVYAYFQQVITEHKFAVKCKAKFWKTKSKEIWPDKITYPAGLSVIPYVMVKGLLDYYFLKFGYFIEVYRNHKARFVYVLHHIKPESKSNKKSTRFGYDNSDSYEIAHQKAVLMLAKLVQIPEEKNEQKKTD
jgi:hypothetical protein